MTPRGFRVAVKGEGLNANMDIVVLGAKQIIEIQFINSSLIGLTLDPGEGLTRPAFGNRAGDGLCITGGSGVTLRPDRSAPDRPRRQRREVAHVHARA